MDDDQALDGQPMGFAQPSTPPLGAYASATLTLVDGDVRHPEAFVAAQNPGPRLDQIAPAPPEVRDAHQPFEAGQGDMMPSDVQRDPRKPIETASFSGNAADFAPPTGQPIVPEVKATPFTGGTEAQLAGAKWAPPTGQPLPPWGAPLGASGQYGQPPGAQPGTVGAIARPGYPGGPSVWGTPPGAPASASYPPVPGRYVVRPVTRPNGAPTTDAQVRRRYAEAPGGMAKFGVVLQATSWPALAMLAVGLLPIGSWSVLLMFVALLVSSSNAKVAKQALNWCFVGFVICYLVTWVLTTAVGTYEASSVYSTLLTVYCAVLLVLLPFVVWRDLENPARRHR